MRAIWKGSVAFGLVSVPVKLYSATEDHDVQLHQVHAADSGRIRYERRCEICGQAVSYADIAKAYDDGERTVVLSADDLASLPAERSRELTIVQFVPREQINPIMYERSYFLQPEPTSVKPYTLLRGTLQETDRVAIVRFALRQRTRLAVLRVHGDLLMVQTLLWADEIRAPQFAGADRSIQISDAELEMSAHLVENYSGDFSPEAFTDEYQQELRTLIEAKIDQGDALDTAETFGTTAEQPAGAEVIDLMEALRRSVERSRAKADQPKNAASTPSAGQVAQTNAERPGRKTG